MESSPGKKARLEDINRSLLKIVLLLLTMGLSLAALVLPISTRPAFVPLKEGGVSPQDIQAPYAFSYESAILTEQSKNEAVLRVVPVYLTADPAIARQQIETLRTVLNFINTVRADSYAGLDQKIVDLASLEAVQFTIEEAEQLITISDARWQLVQTEALSVLEEVMRNTILEGREDQAKRSLPTLISLTLPQDQAHTVAGLVTPFVVANSLYSPELTEQARQEARESVEPVTRSFVTGEIIVRRGQIINPSTWEALQQFNLIQTPNQSREILATSALVLTMASFLTLYFTRRKLTAFYSVRSLVVIALIFVVFLFSARLLIPNRTVMPYLFPLSAFGLTIAVLFHAELAMILTLVLSVLSAYGLPNSLDLSIYYIISSLFGILIVGKGLRISSFITAGFGVGAAGAVIILSYRLPEAQTDLIGLATLSSSAFFAGVAASSLTLVMQFLFAQLLGVSTALQLLEISRPDHPLQQFILQNAPGSFQHSLQVAIMAEQAAEKIGADPLLVRVGAIYHDAGKSLNPSFFIENQVPGKLNPHDDLDPADSAHTIIRHVTDGVQIAKKYHLPNSIIDFVRQHHGTLVTRYQYAKALEAVGNQQELVDLNQFRYPGPRPQSRETALLMLADGVQARARAELPSEEFEMRSIVRKVIDYCQHENQLDDTSLTLRDLNTITESFLKTLQNTYHPRIRYPEIKTLPETISPLQENLEPTQPLEKTAPAK